MKPLLLSLLILTSCCTTPYDVHVQDSADQQVRDILIRRDSHILDLQQAGKDLVQLYGRKIAWRAVLDVWTELTGSANTARAKDIIWLSQQTPHIQSVAWLVNFKSDWLTQ